MKREKEEESESKERERERKLSGRERNAKKTCLPSGRKFLREGEKDTRGS